jgi:hypothetical protein
MSTTETIIFALACTSLYLCLSKWWDRMMIYALVLSFRFEYWMLSRKIRKARKTAKFTMYIEPDHVRIKREAFAAKRNRVEMNSQARITQAIHREREEARIAEKNAGHK